MTATKTDNGHQASPQKQTDARIRRCAILFIELRERIAFDLGRLLAGETGLRSISEWIALAPHLETEIRISSDELEILRQISANEWADRLQAEERFSAPAIERLLEMGLLVPDCAAGLPHHAREGMLRKSWWRPLDAVVHAFSRWHQVNATAKNETSGFATIADMIAAYGLPPSHAHSILEPEQRLQLGRQEPTPFDKLLDRRVTCRNFDPESIVKLGEFERVMQRVFGSQGSEPWAPGALAMKKTSPSAGGLHPVEAYVLLQRVEGIQPGLYHYHAGDHALEPLASGTRESLRTLAGQIVAGQDWFADAPVIVMLAARFQRSFWKYRNHPKAYRTLLLDAGHLSQMLYLTATELNLGAFITAAINEVEIEQAFGLEPMEEGPLAVCGFGVRAAEKVTVEFDPAGKVWA